MIEYKHMDKHMNESKKLLSHGVLAWFIVVLLGFILIVLVFKVGVLVGGLKSHFSSYKAGNHHKNFRGHLWGKGGFSNLIDQKKAKAEAFEAKAESMGMTAEEFKKYLIEQKKAKLAAFEAKAEASGMTIEEYKEYLTEQKN